MQCLDGALRRRKSGHHHARDTGVCLLQLSYQIDAAPRSESHIDQGDVGGKTSDGPSGRACLVGREHLEAPQRQEIGGAVGKVPVVVDNENPPPKS